MDINLLWKVVVVVAALIVGIGSSYIFKMKQDNVIEEMAEEVVRQQTDIDLDMTPTTKEA